MAARWKILPVFIFIALLAMSLRLAEIVTGFSTLAQSGYAVAADAKPDPKTDKPAQIKTDKKSEVTAPKDTAKAGKPKPAAAKTDDPEKWPDAGDAEMDMSNTRMELVKDLVARRNALDKRENDLSAREALIKAAGQELDQKYKELSALRADIETLMKKQSDEEKARTASLVKIYEGMKPKDAARIFDTLDLDILISVMTNMSERKLSPILAQMNDERARTITIMMAEEKKLPALPLSN